MLSNKQLNRLIKENIHNLLTEISIKDKYQKEKQKLNIPFDTFEMLCNLDPTTTPNKVGKYSNWIIAKYNQNTDFNDLKRCLEWYADGLKRGILKRYNIPNDINQFKSYDDFIQAMNGLNENDDTNLSQSEYNQRINLQKQFDVLGSNNFYEIIQPKTFAAERYFGSGTKWCTVANKDYYNSYMRKGPLYIIYPKNGDNNYKMQFHFETKSFADADDDVTEYPSECIESVLQNEQIIDELCNLCKKVFRGYSEYFITFKKRLPIAIQRLSNGENPEDIFDWVDDFENGFAKVRLYNKWNYINTEGKLISDQWFNWVSDPYEDCVKVYIKDKGHNIIDMTGKILSDQWFNWAGDFEDGFARVQLNGKWNYINTEGKLISDQWFDWVGNFSQGFAKVQLNGKWNFLNTAGEYLSDQWFDWIGNFDNGFAWVQLNGKNYSLRQDGVLCAYYTNEPLHESKIHMKQSIRLSENEFKYLIKESVKKILENKYYETIL